MASFKVKEEIFIALSTFSEYSDDPLNAIKQSEFNFLLNDLGRRLLPHEIAGMANNAVGIIAGVELYDESVIEKLPNLRCISRVGVGIENIDQEFASKRGIIIRNTPLEVILPVTELTLGMIFDLCRKLTFHTNLIKEGKWEKQVGTSIAGKRIGILGTGKIGKAVAEALIKLGANVLVFDPNPDSNWVEQNGIHYSTFSDLLELSEILSIHAAIDKDSDPLIGNHEIQRMKDNVIIINTSRGNCLDEEAIFAGLNCGKIGGLGLDVYQTEPYQGRLKTFPNVVLTPHIATLTLECRPTMELRAVQNLLAALSADKI